MLVASLCGTMVYAQTGAVSVNDVTLTKGGTTEMEVTVNNAASNTAFQFDLTLPAGVSVQSVKMGNIVGKKPTETDDTNTRKLKYDVYDANANKYRFLSYDNGNAALTDGKVIVTLAATEEAETGTIAGSEILVVNDEGGKTEQGNGDVASVTVTDGVQIEIPAGGKLAMVSDKPLDFSSLESEGVTAYICVEYDVAERIFWLARVNDVPANTPIIVKGGAGKHTVAAGSGGVYYPQAFMLGNATASFDIDQTAGYNNFAVSKKNGTIAAIPSTTTSLEAGKAYFHVPASIAANVSESKVPFTMGAGGKLACVSNYDLDFTGVEGLKAYAIMGCGQDLTYWLIPVTKASAGTPLYMKGSASVSYPVTSSAVQMAYMNMLKGNNTGAAVTVNPIDGDFTVYALSMKKGVFAKLGSATSFDNGKAWLPLPTAFISAKTRGLSDELMSEFVPELISIKVTDGVLGEDGELTGISRVAAEAAGNDAWYNLSGQRISAPTKKGLYIRNGKKVIVK